MDNLPLAPLAHYLANPGDTEPRPSRPHLIFTASLQVDAKPLNPIEAKSIASDWTDLLRRASILSYNAKIDRFSKAQCHFDTLYESARSEDRASWTPLRLKVVTVKPRWLCGTYAFHEFLGFSSQKQAANIAHGCAAALNELSQLDSNDLAAWTRRPCRGLIDANNLMAVFGGESGARKGVRSPRSGGQCWFRSDGALCPFSEPALRVAQLQPATITAVSRIYDLCGKPETHQSPPDALANPVVPAGAT